MAQVVLTGGNRNLQRLNAVAGDKGKRAVAPSARGRLLPRRRFGEDERRRDQARTYITLGFEDTRQRPPVTIGMAIEARKSESNETVLAASSRSAASSLQGFCRGAPGRPLSGRVGRCARAVVTASAREFRQSSRPRPRYVREYMRHLLPHGSAGEQNANSCRRRSSTR